MPIGQAFAAHMATHNQNGADLPFRTKNPLRRGRMRDYMRALPDRALDRLRAIPYVAPERRTGWASETPGHGP